MNSYSFNTYVTIIAESHDESISVFDYKLKYGNVRSDEVYVAEIALVEENI